MLLIDVNKVSLISARQLRCPSSAWLSSARNPPSSARLCSGNFSSNSSLFSFVCVSQPLLGHNLGPLALSSQLPNTTNVHTVASGPKGLQVGIRIGFSLRTNKRRINHSRISSWQFSATCTIHGTLKQSGNETYILLKNWQLLISRDLTKTRPVSF